MNDAPDPAKPLLTGKAIYEKVRDHLLKQGNRAEVDIPNKGFGFSCAYRGERGTKCAAGCLIDDAHYSPEFEGVSLSVDRHSAKFETSERIWKAIFDSGVEDTPANRRLVTKLQDIHDHAPIISWPGALFDLALRFGFEEPGPEVTIIS